ncbi:MAG: hypothetical protein Q8J62_06205 [Candidatus Cloacimonadaceae bacterium]|nr:hypothetical protein [Candidatus Cloacimonadaceae bacterium]
MKKHAYENIMNPLSALESQLLQVPVRKGYDGIEHAVLIFEEDPQNFFEALAPVVRFIQKNRLGEPLIINRLFIETSLDSYPLEFIDICSSYRNLFAKKDMLADLRFAKMDVRLQMERELKGNWLLTRQAVLEHPKRIRRIKEVINMSRFALYPVVKGFFALTDKTVPKDLESAIAPAAQICGIDLEFLRARVKDLQDVYAYLRMLENLMIRVQSWEL